MLPCNKAGRLRPVLHLQNIFRFLISDALLLQKSEIAALVRFYTLVSGIGDSSKSIVAVQVDLVPCLSRRVEATALMGYVGRRPKQQSSRSWLRRSSVVSTSGASSSAASAAGISRRHAVHAATATAVVLAALGIIANSVIAVAASVASIGGPQRLSDWEEEQGLLPVRQEEQVLPV
jgi:hypothetical protein